MKMILIALIFWQIGFWSGVYLTETMNVTSINKEGKTHQLFTKNYICKKVGIK